MMWALTILAIFPSRSDTGEPLRFLLFLSSAHARRVSSRHTLCSSVLLDSSCSRLNSPWPSLASFGISYSPEPDMALMRRSKGCEAFASSNGLFDGSDIGAAEWGSTLSRSINKSSKGLNIPTQQQNVLGVLIPPTPKVADVAYAEPR